MTSQLLILHQVLLPPLGWVSDTALQVAGWVCYLHLEMVFVHHYGNLWHSNLQMRKIQNMMTLQPSLSALLLLRMIESLYSNSHHIFTHWRSITFSDIMVWLFISHDHCIMYSALIWTFPIFNQLNPYSFNEYMAEYPPIISPLHLTACCFPNLMSYITYIMLCYVHYIHIYVSMAYTPMMTAAHLVP